MSTRTDLITDLDAFAALEGEWNSLLEASAADTVFLTHEWMFRWWKYFGMGRLLQLVTVRQDGELIAIAPLMRTPAKLQPFRPLSALEFLGFDHVTSDYLDIIVRRGRETAAREALVAYFASRRKTLDLVQIDEAGSEAGVICERLGALSRRPFTLRKTSMSVSRVIALSGLTWDGYLGTLGSSHRYNVRRRRRNLAKQFEVQIDVVKDESQRQAALADLVQLHNMRWQGRGEKGAFSTADILRFHDEISQKFLALGWLRLFILRMNGTPAAAFYGFRYKGTYSFYQHGLDPQHSKLSVGQVLLGMSIEYAIEEGADVYDFLSGENTYKDLWAKDNRSLIQIEACPAGWPAAVRVTTEMARQAKRRLMKLAGRKPVTVEYAPAAGDDAEAAPPADLANATRKGAM